MLPLLATLATAEPRVLLYTMGAGDDLLSRWGHAALCVLPRDKTSGPCYDFGHTDYSSTFGVIWEFYRAEGQYWGESENLLVLVKRFRLRDQSVWSQELRLAPGEADKLAAKLAASVEGDEKYYVYHHFHDNCSTRVRDFIDEATGGALRRDSDTPDGPSYRAIAELGLSGFWPLQVALELGLGRESDRRTTPWQRMLHPDELRAQVAARLGAEPRVVYARKGPPPADQSHHGRWMVGGTGLVLGGLVAGLNRNDARAAAFVAGLAAGLPGLVFWLSAAVTALGELRWNEVLLCLLPVDLALPWLPRADRYAELRLAGLALVAVLWAAGVLVQPLGPVLLLAAAPLAAWRFLRPAVFSMERLKRRRW